MNTDQDRKNSDFQQAPPDIQGQSGSLVQPVFPVHCKVLCIMKGRIQNLHYQYLNYTESYWQIPYI